MSARDPYSWQDPAVVAREKGYTHIMLVEERGDVPPYTRVKNWTLTQANGASDRHRAPIALVDLATPAAPRWCYNPRLYSQLRSAFAAALMQLPPAPADKPGVATIIARPVVQNGSSR